MAETGDIVAGATGVGAFFGALFGAWKIFKPAGTPAPGNGDVNVLAQKIAELDRRQLAMDERIDDVFHLLGGVKDSLSQAQADVREALTRLQERRK